MGRLELAVDDRASMLAHETGKMDERQFAAAGNQGEHALTEKRGTDADAIKSTYQLLALPHLHTGGEALLVKSGVGVDYVLPQPCPFHVEAAVGLTAVVYHPLEILVDAEPIKVLAQERAHGMGDVNLVGENDEALHRTIPDGLIGIAKRIPGKDAMAISQ